LLPGGESEIRGVTVGRASRLLAAALCVASAVALAHPGYDADIARLTAAIDEAPSVELYLARADRLRLQQRHAEADRDLGQAERLGASPSDISLLRGFLRADQGDAAGALAELNRYFARGGASAKGLRTRARLLREAGRVDEAVQDLARAVRQGADPEPCLELADAEDARGRTEDAARALDGCLEKLRGAATVRKRLIALRLKQRDFGRAEALAREAMVGLQVKAEWSLIAADALERAGKRDAARAERQGALAELDRVLAGRGGGLHQLLRAQTLAGLGRRAEARAQLEVLLAARPDFVDAQALLAELNKHRVKGRTP
jgi:tetratricopeptide (TPR) repeat protein